MRNCCSISFTKYADIFHHDEKLRQTDIDLSRPCAFQKGNILSSYKYVRSDVPNAYITILKVIILPNSIMYVKYLHVAVGWAGLPYAESKANEPLLVSIR